MTELERTYLAKSLPDNLAGLKKKEVADIYLPARSEHPVLRIRKNGDSYEITNKQPARDGDSSEMIEQTVGLTPEEYADLAVVPGKRVRKLRHYLPYQGRMAEVDVFQDDLAGLVLVDFEFETAEAKNSFAMPEFCLAEVTQAKELAGGMLCGKRYADIQPFLEGLGYRPLR
jgi:adenylate cyclase